MMVISVGGASLRGEGSHPQPYKAHKTTPTAPYHGGDLRADSVYGDLTVSVVIPALNEAQNLQFVLPRIPAWVHEVVLVDGHSSDDTVEVARALMPDIRVIQQKGHGKGAALRSGFAAATGDIMVMLDADGSTDPAEIPAFVGALVSGADFAKGSRFLQGGGTSDMPCYRCWGNWGLTMLVRLLFGGRYSDLCYGYNAFWSRVVPLLRLDADGFEIETMMNVRSLGVGLKVIEVPSFETARMYGVGRLRTIPDGWRVLKTILRERFNRRMRDIGPELADANLGCAVETVVEVIVDHVDTVEEVDQAGGGLTRAVGESL